MDTLLLSVLFTLWQRLVYIPFTLFHSHPPDPYCHCTFHSVMKTITLENVTKAVSARDFRNNHEMQGKDHFQERCWRTQRGCSRVPYGVQCVLHLSVTFSPQPFSPLY